MEVFFQIKCIILDYMKLRLRKGVSSSLDALWVLPDWVESLYLRAIYIAVGTSLHIPCIHSKHVVEVLKISLH